MVPILRAKKRRSRSLASSSASILPITSRCPIRDAISEKLLVQRNTFLVDKHIEGNHNIPTASLLNDLYPQKFGIARSYQRADAKETILAHEKPF